MIKVSIITPCYNSASWIERTLKSVQRQTFTDWEMIVVDDGSSDSSAHLVQAAAEHEPRLRLVSQPNGGVCNARNNGFKQISASSKYLLFLDADDCLEPEMLQTLVTFFDDRPCASMVCCGYVYIDENDCEIETPPAPRWAPTRFGLRALKDTEIVTPWIAVFAGAPFLPGLSLLRRDIYEQSDGWDEKLGQHHEELDLFLRLAFQGEVYYLADKLYRYRRRPGQSSANVENCARQDEKFHRKWIQGEFLSVSQKAVVQRGFHFVKGRVEPYARWQAARDCWNQKQFYAASRLAVGAALRYVRALIS